MVRIFLVLVAAAVCIQVEAQRKSQMQIFKAKATICYAGTDHRLSTIGPPQNFNRGARVQTANISVTYQDFTPEAQAAFQRAVDIWESIIDTDVTINILARWAPLGAGVLGSAGPSNYLSDFDGAPKKGVLYPISLAEKIAGKELNDSTEPDIVATFNSTNDSWHYNASDVPENEYDLSSIVLHEIGHGLGITNGYELESGKGIIPDYLDGRPVVYETNLIDASGENMVSDFTPPSADLGHAMTTSMFFSSPLVRAVNDGDNAKIYTPSVWNPGSSIAHLDEDTYPKGNPNSLMTPFADFGERILNPGPIVIKILEEMGWVSTRLAHTPLKNTEDTSGPFTAVAKVVNTNGYDPSSVKLHYKTTGSFTAVTMTATGNTDEFKADFPAGSSSYSYYISVEDDDSRTFTNPGVIIEPGSAPQQAVYVFETGPDHEAPVINHIPKEFVSTTEDLDLEAIISDNIGIDNAKVEWKINEEDQTAVFMALVPNTDSTYAVVIPLTGLTTSDKIQYRIRAEDSSVAGNVSYKPSASTYYTVNVVGLGETQNGYVNNFDDLSGDDFFGNGFSVTTPAGFGNGAIHSTHPYPEGGADGAHVDLIYNLKTPIRIADDPEDAVMKFDEIVLVEPGEDGVAWPNDNFFDYVVVEGSSDGGLNWVPLADGYDSRYNADWESLWNSTISGNNSTGTGDPSLFRQHVFNLHDKFNPGEEVAFRFRLYSDPFSSGWGWAIDNLVIQVDDVPPVVLHQHIDFILEGTKPVLEMKITDSKGVSQIFFDYKKSTDTDFTSLEIIVTPAEDIYKQTIDPEVFDLAVGDVFQYRIRAIDMNDNVGAFPSVDGVIEAPLISLSSSVDQLVDNFNADGDPNFIGNFFDVVSASGFSDPAMHSVHPYSSGLDIDYVSEFSWLTKTPVKVSSDNPMIYYEDVALVEFAGNDVKDYVVVEASKDGINWEPLVDPYAANSVNLWKSTFNAGQKGTKGLYEKHVVDITSSGAFVAGDVVLIRFRLHSDSTGTGWGWAVDNVSIQGPVTAVEPTISSAGFDAWPNPVTDGAIHVSMQLPGASEVSVEFLTMQGQTLSSDRFSAPSGDFQRDYEVNNWPNGFYVVRLRSDFGTSVKKIIKLN